MSTDYMVDEDGWGIATALYDAEGSTYLCFHDPEWVWFVTGNARSPSTFSVWIIPGSLS